MKKIFFKIPDTPAEIRAKIGYLETQTESLTGQLARQKDDLLKNHLKYSHYVLSSKKQGLDDLTKKISSNQAKIKNLKSKLPGGKTDKEPKYPF